MSSNPSWRCRRSDLRHGWARIITLHSTYLCSPTILFSRMSSHIRCWVDIDNDDGDAIEEIWRRARILLPLGMLVMEKIEGISIVYLRIWGDNINYFGGLHEGGNRSAKVGKVSAKGRQVSAKGRQSIGERSANIGERSARSGKFSAIISLLNRRLSPNIRLSSFLTWKGVYSRSFLISLSAAAWFM